MWRQKISSRVRAPAFAGATTGLRGGRNALGAPPEALQRPHATSYHLLTTFVPLTPTSEKHYPTRMVIALRPEASAPSARAVLAGSGGRSGATVAAVFPKWETQQFRG